MTPKSMAAASVSEHNCCSQAAAGEDGPSELHQLSNTEAEDVRVNVATNLVIRPGLRFYCGKDLQIKIILLVTSVETSATSL